MRVFLLRHSHAIYKFKVTAGSDAWMGVLGCNIITQASGGCAISIHTAHIAHVYMMGVLSLHIITQPQLGVLYITHVSTMGVLYLYILHILHMST